jgi:prephenate dehydratase
MSEVAVLGPAGTFSAKAAKIMYPDAKFIYVDDVEEVFKFVVDGNGLGVAAIENSLEGSVGTTLESLLRYDVKIVGSITLDIDLYLMAKKGVKKTAVKTILSHSHALAQCRKYLTEKYPDAKAQTSSSTAEAMRQAGRKAGIAAVGNLDAGLGYGLVVLNEHIQDEDSQTKFITISKSEASGPKTSIIFAAKDEPGSLYGILKIFADQRINLTKIESRPSRKRLGEYMFYVDYQNNSMKMEDIKRLHERIQTKTTFFKDLGSY